MKSKSYWYSAVKPRPKVSEHMTQLIRRIWVDILYPLELQFPNARACGFFDQVDGRQVSVYVFILPEEISYVPNVIRFLEGRLQMEALLILHVAHVVIPDSKEGFCCFWTELTPPLYDI